MPTYIITDNTIAQNATGTQYTGVADNYCWSISPTSNNGSNTALSVSNFGVGDNEYKFIRGDGLLNIPSSETVTAATLYLYQVTGGNSHPVDMRRFLQAWTEGGSNFNTYDGTNSWNTGGGLGAGTDRVSTPISSTSIGTTTGQYYGLNCTSYVADVVSGVIASDEGVHLQRGDIGNDSTFKLFTSSNGADGQRPEWVVTTTAGSGRIMGGLAGHGGLAGLGGIAGIRGGLAG